MKRGFLAGKKTYVMAIVAVVGSLAAWSIGEISLHEALTQAWIGGVAATFRAAVAKIA